MDSVVPASPSGHQRTKSSRNRKRSMRACLSCRFRKVRCDVSLRGQPCTNCDLDCKNCLVVGRASRMSQQAPRNRTCRPSQDDFQPDPRQLSDQLEDNEDGENNEDGETSNVSNAAAAPSTTGTNDGPGLSLFHHLPDLDSDMVTFADPINTTGSFEGHLSDSEAAEQNLALPRYSDGPPLRGTSSPEQRPAGGYGTRASDIGSAHPGKQRAHPNATVLFLHYPYLKVENIHKIAQQDLSYLEGQGCLHVPNRPILDNFMEQYFRHVHILLPLLNEGDFWDMYSQKDTTASRANMSLLVFQAMLFASCNFVPLQVIRQLGFSCLRTARAEFYRRTKLLYDLESESHPLPLAQSALLMMGWVPPSNTTLSPYKTWLSLAIQHARNINADRYAEMPELAESRSPAQRKYQNALHRLWWCCIILDRISPLCTRFSLQITHDRFDFKNSIPLGTAQLEDDIYRSSVFTPATKRRQIGLFSQFLELIILLTDVLALTYPFENSVMSKSRFREDEDLDLETCDASMKAWYLRVTAQNPPFGDQFKDHHEKSNEPDKSVILHTNLMYIYYHTAYIALCHYKILRQSVASSSVSGEAAGSERSLQLQQSCFELQDAAQKITKCYEELTRRRLARWLPITAVACIATPLALHTVTARLSSLSKELACNGLVEMDPTSASNQKRLNVLVETMSAFGPQYYGVEWVRETARYVANLAQIDSQSLFQAGRTSVTDWSQILRSQPNTYLRMIWAVDVCISKGRLPEECDFPAWLRRLLRKSKGFGSKPQNARQLSFVAEQPTEQIAFLDYDLGQILNSIPSLGDPIPPQQPGTDENSFAEPLLEVFDTEKPGISHNRPSQNDLVSDGGPCHLDVEGTGWDFFEAMQGATDGQLDRLALNFMA